MSVKNSVSIHRPDFDQRLDMQLSTVQRWLAKANEQPNMARCVRIWFVNFILEKAPMILGFLTIVIREAGGILVTTTVLQDLNGT